MHYDVFNGDADGIIALLQLRFTTPRESKLITGVKRDISLLKQVDLKVASSITVLDISMEKNIEALNNALIENIPVFYVDHHRSGDIPEYNNLQAIIDTDANTCTSLLVNEYLAGKYDTWAIAAAYGDNMIAYADHLANQLELSQEQRDFLSNLGIYINYNGYGGDLEDLHFPPAELYKLLSAYPDPFTLLDERDSVFYLLEKAYKNDMGKAQAADILHDDDICQVLALPDEAWARRVSGVYGNDLANAEPDKAHAVITANNDNSYRVSLRAPLNNKQGAGDICASFDTGGGRAAAAGINYLPAEQLAQFISSVRKYYQDKF